LHPGGAMRKLSRVWWVSCVLVIAGLLTQAGCGGGSIDTPADTLRHSGSFALTPDASPLMDGQFSGELRLEQLQAGSDGSDISIRVLVAGARSYKASYFMLDYDATRYTPIAVETGPVLRGLAEPGPLLELYELDRPGRVYCGQCLARWDKAAGFSGDGLVATLRFARRACSTLARAVSTPPDSLLSQANLNWDSGTSTLSWRYYNQGDYD
jgi:hypothetical protein